MITDDDERSRALERRARETGAPEDEAAWLAARVRAGALEREPLELAALLGQEAARLAVGGEPLDDDARLAALVRRIDLGYAGGEPPPLLHALLVRLTAVALGALVDHGSSAPATITRTLRAAEAWIVCPCDAHADEYFAASTDSYPAGQGEGCYSVEPPGSRCGPGSGCSSGAGSVIPIASDPRVGRARVMQAARRDLVPWLLGAGDPLVERIRGGGG